MLRVKETFLVFLAVLVLYLGVFTLKEAPNVTPSATATNVTPADFKMTATWAGLLGITFGLVSILVVLFAAGNNPKFEANNWTVIALLVLLASAYYNYMTVKDLDKNANQTLNSLLYVQIIAHVAIVVVLYMDAGSFDSKGMTSGMNAALQAFGNSPRVSIRSK